MRNMKIVNKNIIKPKPTAIRKDAVEIRYLCNQAVNIDWRKTDISNRKINCKNCKRILKNNRLLK